MPGDATYGIFGDRGTARLLDIQLHDPHCCMVPRFGVVVNLSLGSPAVDPAPLG